MNTYLLIFFILLSFSFLEISNVSNKILIVLRGLILFIFVFVAGLRYETGVDWLAYEHYFDEIIPLNNAFNFNNFGDIFLTLDIGYSLLNSIIKMFGWNIQVIFLIVSVISTILLIKNLKYYSNHVLTSLLIYFPFFFFIFDMSGLRQGLAIQIVLFSLKFIQDKRFNKFLFCILLATSVHWTAIVLLPLYFFSNVKINFKFTLFVVLMSTVIFTFKVKWLGAILGDLMNQLNAFTMLSDKLTAYTTNEVFAQERAWDLFSIYNFIRITLILIFIQLYKDKISKDTPCFNILYNFVLFELICAFCLYEFFEISERLRFYFTIAEVILLSKIIFVYKNHIIRIFALLVLSVGVFLNAYPFLLQFPSTVAYHPYQNYLVYKLLDLHSDGYSRLQEHRASHE